MIIVLRDSKKLRGIIVSFLIESSW